MRIILILFLRLFSGKKTDGYDCGDEVADFLTNFLDLNGKKLVRLIYFDDKLYSERNCPTKSEYWINPVPQLNDQVI